MKVITTEEAIKKVNSNPRVDYSHFFTRCGDISKLLINRMLTGPGRNFVILIVKAPLEKAIIKAARLLNRNFGNISKETTFKRKTHLVMDMKKEFFRHYINPGKMDLLDAAFDVLAYEIEHDVHYEAIFDKLIIMINEKIKSGEWLLLEGKFPQEKCWKE